MNVSHGGSSSYNKKIFFSKSPKRLKVNNKNDKNNNKKPAKKLKEEYQPLLSLIIKNVEDKKKYINPFKLNTAIKKLFPNAVNCELLAYGDIKVYFKTVQDEIMAKNVQVHDVFGPKSILVVDNYSSHRIVIHHVPEYISVDDFYEYFKENKINTRYITEKPLKNNENFKTIFVNLLEKQTMDKLLDLKYLKISNRKFKISKFINKNVIQCFNCQRFGHTSAICTSKKTICRFCAENHLSKDCKNKDKIKCANCGKNHKANSINCMNKQDKIAIKNRWALKDEKMVSTLNLHEDTIKKAKKRFNIKPKMKKKRVKPQPNNNEDYKVLEETFCNPNPVSQPKPKQKNLICQLFQITHPIQSH